MSAGTRSVAVGTTVRLYACRAQHATSATNCGHTMHGVLEQPGAGAEGEPAARRRARWAARAANLRAQADAARERHAPVDFCFGLVERDASIGGGLLAGALAYRLFVLLLPTCLLLVSGLGIYADMVDQSTSSVVRDAGLPGLIGSEVAAAASGSHRGLLFLLSVPAIVYALVALYRAVAKVHALAWLGSARGVRTSPKGVALLGVALVVEIVTLEVVSWIEDAHRYGGLAALLVYVVAIGGTWLAVSVELPHRDVPWTALVPGALLFGVGLLVVHAFNVYVTTRLVEGRADTYGALGIATALLFSLVLVGRLMVTSAELNVALDERRTQRHDAVSHRG
jgi:uncharacterized BrkB/YihY/UPF0761 family membrane protein